MSSLSCHAGFLRLRMQEQKERCLDVKCNVISQLWSRKGKMFKYFFWSCKYNKCFSILTTSNLNVYFTVTCWFFVTICEMHNFRVKIVSNPTPCFFQCATVPPLNDVLTSEVRSIPEISQWREDEDEIKKASSQGWVKH